MRVEIVRIGNSRGVRIPKSVLDLCQLSGEVDMSVENGRIILTPIEAPRRGWADGFARAAGEDGDETLLKGAGETEFDREEWTW